MLGLDLEQEHQGDCLRWRRSCVSLFVVPGIGSQDFQVEKVLVVADLWLIHDHKLIRKIAVRTKRFGRMRMSSLIIVCRNNKSEFPIVRWTKFVL